MNEIPKGEQRNRIDYFEAEADENETNREESQRSEPLG
jgi:hypothetical protein